MVIARIDLREHVPANIVKGAGLENTINQLLATFEAGEEKNAELVNKFFEQTYFKGEESLIDKLTEVNPHIQFDDIEKEEINLAILLYDKWMRAFNDCMNKIGNDDIKKAFMQLIHDKVRNEIGVPTAPYNDFDTECTIPGNTNVAEYFQIVERYLASKQGAGGAAKPKLEILKEIKITNKDLNDILLAAGSGIPTGISLSNPTVPNDIKDAFDILLSFEIGKEADRAVHISKDIGKQFQGLLTNSFPAINTIVGEIDEYKYDESKLGTEYESKLQTITNNTALSGEERKNKINDLKWEYYLKYLKKKNAKIGNALEQLYNNNFDYSKLEPRVLQDYLDKVADIRLKMLFESGSNDIIKLNWGNLDEFKRFYKELANVDPNNPILNLTLSDVTIPGATTPPMTGLLNIPIQKKLVGGENMWLKDDIEQFGKNAEKSFDALPIEFTIKKSDIENNPNIAIEDKTKLSNLLSSFYQSDGDKYVITGEKVGILIYLFFIINNRNPITELSPIEQKKIESLFGQAKNHKDRPNTNGTGHEVSTSEDLKKEFEKLGPGKFENGSEIWLPVGSSEIPGGGYQWIKIKISDINTSNGTFKGTFFGGELEFDSKFEGKSREFKINKETIEELKQKSKNGKVLLLPNPNRSDFNSYKELLKNEFPFPSAGMTRDNNKFMQKITDENGKEKDVEVKYFSAPGDDTSLYEIEYNPIRKSFTVSSKYNGDEKGKNGKTEKKRISYKREMDWNNFLIFFTQKGLVPQTEQEANDTIIRQYNEFKIVNGGKWKLNRFSFNNVKHGLKDIFGTLKKKMDDYNKNQDEKFRKSVESGILNAIGAIPFLPASLKSAIGERQQEIYNEGFNGAWKEIEGYLKALQSDEQFADTFDQVPSHVQTIYGKSYRQFIKDLFDKKGETTTTEKRKAAALLLANIQKGGSPYRGLSGEENSGLWVKVILGNFHYGQFLRDKQKCIHDLKNAGKEKDQIQDVLATCEMDYIMNNVNGANGKLKYFGSHEGRGIPGNEDNTNYIPNPSKRLLSEKFSKELKNAYKGWFDKSAVENAFGEIKHNDFNLAKEDFKRLIKSSRFPGAVANLKKMFMLAKNDQQQSEYQKCFLLYMLSGILDVNGKKDLRKQTYQWAKTMGFLPGMLAKETSHSEKVVELLDDFCEEKGYGKFSNIVKSYFHEGDLKDGKLKIDNLIKDLDGRWDVNKMKDFENYSKSTFLSKHFPKGSVLNKLQESALNTDIENIDNSLLDNPLVANSGGLLSNINVVDDRISFRNGEFEGKDPDERNNRKEFWRKIKDEIRMKNANNIEDLSLLLKQYFSRFRFSDREEIYKRIKTASVWKNEIGKEKYFENDEHIKDSMGIIGPKEIESIIRYAFKGHTMYNRFNGRLPDELNDVLDAFQDKFNDAFNYNMFEKSEIISKIFDITRPENIQPYGLGSWSKYNRAVTGREYVIDDEGGNGAPGDLKKKEKNRVKKNFTSGNFINKKIADMENSFKRLPEKQYKSYTNATLNDLMSRFYDEAA